MAQNPRNPGKNSGIDPEVSARRYSGISTVDQLLTEAVDAGLFPEQVAVSAGRFVTELDGSTSLEVGIGVFRNGVPRISKSVVLTEPNEDNEIDVVADVSRFRSAALLTGMARSAGTPNTYVETFDTREGPVQMRLAQTAIALTAGPSVIYRETHNLALNPSGLAEPEGSSVFFGDETGAGVMLRTGDSQVEMSLGRKLDNQISGRNFSRIDGGINL